MYSLRICVTVLMENPHWTTLISYLKDNHYTVIIKKGRGLFQHQMNKIHQKCCRPLHHYEILHSVCMLTASVAFIKQTSYDNVSSKAN